MAMRSGIIHWKRWFSTVMLVYQRVSKSEYHLGRPRNGRMHENAHVMIIFMGKTINTQRTFTDPRVYISSSNKTKQHKINHIMYHIIPYYISNDFIHMSLSLFIYICIYICVYIYIYMHIHNKCVHKQILHNIQYVNT